MFRSLLLSTAALSLAAPAFAQDRSDVFGLGEIVVIGKRVDGVLPPSTAVIDHEQMWTFEKSNLEQAINLVPGVNSQFDSNGRRNESDIFVRGFGRWQVPLLVDGIRVYLPADNRLDFSRFLTGDVAEIQVQKGYASVIDGPGGMGGEINLVSRKPTQPFEAEVQAGVNFGSGFDYEGRNVYAMAGSRQENYYVQGSISSVDRDYWKLSGDYAPTATSMQPAGHRLNSDSNDWRVNAKAGFTPNGTDEYVINYTRQEGEKGGLLNVYNNPQVPPNSFWRWPRWNIQSVAFLSNTQIGDQTYLKTKAYYNTFINDLFAYDDISYTTQSANGRFRSYYNDDAYGVSVEAGTDALPMNSLKLAFHYREDGHDEYNDNRPTSTTARTVEPTQHQAQETWSVAGQDTFHLSSDWDLTGGVSYDKYRVTASEDYNTTAGLFSYPKGGADAFNGQAALIWRYSTTGELHASVSDRARFPIFFELYSTRFGTAVPNPNLGPERAVNWEVGLKQQLAGNTRFEAAAFYSDVRDLIQTVQITAGTTPQTQTQNVGNGTFYGFEVSFDTALSSSWTVGGNYTYIHRAITDTLQPFLQPTGVPNSKAFLYAAWEPVAALKLTPSLEVASKRWSDQTTSPALANPYTRVGDYALLNFQAAYHVTTNLEVAVGAKNLLDDNYELSWGLPQQGRNFYAKARFTY